MFKPKIKRKKWNKKTITQ